LTSCYAILKTSYKQIYLYGGVATNQGVDFVEQKQFLVVFLSIFVRYAFNS